MEPLEPLEADPFCAQRQGGPPVLPQDPVGDWLDLGEDHRLQLQVPSSVQFS